MVQRKRVTAVNRMGLSADAVIREQRDPNDNETLLPFLSHVTEGCYVADVSPSACIPLYLNRKQNRNAVATLKSIINGDCQAPDRLLCGMVSGSPTSVVVPLQGDLSYLFDDYMETQCDSVNDAHFMKSRHEVWYGVVDGCQLHGGIVER